MFDVTFTEFVLFLWATVATGFAFYFHAAAHKAAVMLYTAIRDEEVYQHFKTSWEVFKNKL